MKEGLGFSGLQPAVLLSLRKQLQAASPIPSVLIRLAEIERQLGDLPAAASAYDGCVPADDRAAAWAALMRGHPSPPKGPRPYPAPFLMIDNFFAPACLSRLRGYFAAGDSKIRPQPSMTEKPESDDEARGESHGHLGKAQAGELELLISTMLRIEDAAARLGITEDIGETFAEAGLRSYPVNGRCDVHRDSGGDYPPRVLSLIGFLHEDPQAFEGGDLLLYDETADGARRNATRIRPRSGALLVFPSHCWHEVTPITRTPPAAVDGRLVFIGWIHRK